VNEAGILRLLKQQKHVATEYIVEFVDFFSGDDAHFLVMDYIEHSMSLAVYIQTIHRLKREGILKTNKLLKITKFIFWQLAVALQWLHDEMDCAHLDLCSENVLVHSNFERTDKGTIVVHNDATLKLIDFGCSQIFKNSDFRCDKFATAINGRINREQYLAPKVSSQLEYDARAADMWALGIMFFEALIGDKPFDSIPFEVDSLGDCYSSGSCSRSSPPIEETNSGYWAIYGGRIREHFQSQNIEIGENSLEILEGLLTVEEISRWNAARVLNARYFKSYHKMYQEQIFKNAGQRKRKKRRAIKVR